MTRPGIEPRSHRPLANSLPYGLILFKPWLGPLSKTTTLGQSGPWGDDNEGVLRILQSPCNHWNLTIGLFSVICRALIGGWGLTSLQRDSRCILQLLLTGQFNLVKGQINYNKEKIKTLKLESILTKLYIYIYIYIHFKKKTKPVTYDYKFISILLCIFEISKYTKKN